MVLVFQCFKQALRVRRRVVCLSLMLILSAITSNFVVLSLLQFCHFKTVGVLPAIEI